MKWLQRQSRVAKNEVLVLSRAWCAGAILLMSLLVGVQVVGVSGQEKPVAGRVPSTTPPPPRTQGSTEGYRYNAEGRRDPLQPLLKDIPPEALRPTKLRAERALEPLERFDISTLKLVGIVWGKLGRKALIKAPDGKSYFASLETYMGKYNGKVIAIENDHLVIEEQYLNAEDKVVPKTLMVPLRRKDKKEG